MPIRNALGGVAVVGTLLIAAAAEAAPVFYDFEGVFTDGRDVTGVFGAAGSDLAGVSLSGRFVRDDAAPDAVMFDDGVQTYISGAGAVYGSVVVNGRSWSFGNTSGIQSQEANACGASGCFDSFHFGAEDDRQFFSNGGFFYTLSAFTFGGLAPGGELFVTFPLGHNLPLDAQLFAGELGFDETRFLRRVSAANTWREVGPDDARGASYGAPYEWGNVIAVGRRRRSST